ncbi:MAG: GNAT family N-acetyltransferase [Paucimonas sp.]|jgi:GNAT superfamily N-acetyltransferase|nr:GNAT family N-acetyltransferase [Paucimonas sp.]
MPIRPTLAKDLAHLPAIERSAAQTFRQVPGLAWLADSEVMEASEHQRLLDAGTSWVAVDAQDCLVGFLCAEVVGTALHVHELSVGQAAQGQGLGRQLLEQALAQARLQRLHSVTLTTFADVPWNRPFYERLGFCVLPLAELDARLSAILAAERAHGLEGRCAMALVLS